MTPNLNISKGNFVHVGWDHIIKVLENGAVEIKTIDG